MATDSPVGLALPRCSRCGLENGRNGQPYCHACHAAYMRRTRKPYRYLSAWEKTKSAARSYTRVLQIRGVLQKGPCVMCGATEAQNHHPDYGQPRVVIRLCRPCHKSLHNKLSQ